MKRTVRWAAAVHRYQPGGGAGHYLSDEGGDMEKAAATDDYTGRERESVRKQAGRFVREKGRGEMQVPGVRNTGRGVDQAHRREEPVQRCWHCRKAEDEICLSGIGRGKCRGSSVRSMGPPDQHDNQECGGGKGRYADPAPPRCLPWLGDGTRASLAQQLCSELTCEGGVGASS